MFPEKCNRNIGSKVVWSEQLNQRKCTELDDIFEKEFDEGVDGRAFDCVFTFNYSPVMV
ncbi:MAG: hypothetical protein ACLR7D_01490 [Lachnospira eligens]